MKKSMKYLSVATFAIMLMTTNQLYAGGSHSHGHDNNDGHHNNSSSINHDGYDSVMDGMFLVKKNIDGYDVSFHVMKATPSKEMGVTHNFLIKVEKDGKALVHIPMSTKVVHPNGRSETKKTMVMGDWLMAGYDLDHKGKHQLMILFKTADGQKHKGGVYYPV